jgi:class 3 adenylate cyclase
LTVRDHLAGRVAARRMAYNRAMDAPPIQYAKTSDGVSIAFWTIGEGPPLVMLPSPVASNIQVEWGLDYRRAAFERLAERATVIRYDWRGLGVSQHDCLDFSAEAAGRDFEAVIQHLRLDRVAVMGNSRGASALTYLSEHFGDLSHLIITVSPFPRGFMRRAAAALSLIEHEWETGTEVIARLAAGWDNPQSAQLAAWVRATTNNPATYRAAISAWATSLSANFTAVQVPSLILHAMGHESSTRVAAAIGGTIPRAHMLGVPGWPLGLGINETMVTAILDFINAVPTAAGRPIAAPQVDISAVRTIVFTDVEDSTALNERLGDEGARNVMREHERLTREALGQHGGSEVKAMGDGFMAWFPSATRALECAIALQRALDERNAAGSEAMLVRIGINAGEPIAEGDDLFGASVIAAARISARAKGGQILASDVVRQLLAGKGFIFGDQGEHSLKGFDEPVRLFEVSWRESG